MPTRSFYPLFCSDWRIRIKISTFVALTFSIVGVEALRGERYDRKLVGQGKKDNKDNTRNYQNQMKLRIMLPIMVPT